MRERETSVRIRLKRMRMEGMSIELKIKCEESTYPPPGHTAATLPWPHSPPIPTPFPPPHPMATLSPIPTPFPPPHPMATLSPHTHALPSLATPNGDAPLTPLSPPQVIGIFCMACAAPAWTNGTHWFLFVVVTAFVSTALWCFIYLLNLKSAINLPIDWLLTELLNTAITTLLYLIAVIVQFCSIQQFPGRNIAGGIFGIFNLIAYAIGSFYLYRDWKDSHPHSSFSGSVLKRNP
nr:uncharacterized protein LOC113809872 [Penaeus vannamei]